MEGSTTMAESLPARRLPLAGAYNLRDVGGYPAADGGQTRWRTLFRADSLHRLTVEEQEALLEYGVRTVIDLRRPDETASAPNVFAASPRVRYLHLSITDSAPDPNGPSIALDELYRRILDDRQAQLGAVLTALSEEGAFPAVVHCTAGKDRTGLIVALLLGIAGVPPEQIVEDYALSAVYLAETFWAEVSARLTAAGIPLERYRQLLASAPETMVATLAYLDERYGGAVGYAAHLGLVDRQLATLPRVGRTSIVPIEAVARVLTTSHSRAIVRTSGDGPSETPKTPRGTGRPNGMANREPASAGGECRKVAPSGPDQRHLGGNGRAATNAQTPMAPRGCRRLRVILLPTSCR
jgi:protein-tyrosine phosphatase